MIVVIPVASLLKKWDGEQKNTEELRYNGEEEGEAGQGLQTRQKQGCDTHHVEQGEGYEARNLVQFTLTAETCPRVFFVS